MKPRMLYSENAVDLVKQFEGCRLHAYQDANGIWTIGYGHTGGVQPRQKITLQNADILLRDDLMVASNAINDSVTVTLTQDEFDALVSFVYNLGAGIFKRSTLLDDLNHCRFLDAAKEFDRWTYAGGKQLAGLLKRRQAETDLFEGITCQGSHSQNSPQIHSVSPSLAEQAPVKL